MKSILFFTALALAPWAQPPATEHVLDILTYQFRTAPPASKGGGVVEGEVRSHPLAPPEHSLAVTLLDADRRVYNPGDTIIYEVTLENVGRVPVTLPWSPDHVQFSGAKDPLLGILSLEVRDVSGRTLLGRLEPQGLYGSNAVPGTLLRLRPGERARIRVRSVWNNSDHARAAMLQQPGGLVSITAVYISGVREHRSVNGIEVSVLPRGGLH